MPANKHHTADAFVIKSQRGGGPTQEEEEKTKKITGIHWYADELSCFSQALMLDIEVTAWVAQQIVVDSVSERCVCVCLCVSLCVCVCQIVVYIKI